MRSSSVIVSLLIASYANSAVINDSYRLTSRSGIYSSFPKKQEQGQVTERESERTRFWSNEPFLQQKNSPALKRSESASPTPTMAEGPVDARPTPDPTGDPSSTTTVHINSENNFSLILPNKTGELIGDAEVDGVAYCSPDADPSDCGGNKFSEGFVTAAAYSRSEDGAWVQVTGCMNTTKSILDPKDEGGQFDIRYPNGAQCTFGGYGASFIELVEPALNRFCIRCCASSNDQTHCNSHQDRMGCINAVPGTYDFPDLGISCS